MLQALLPLGMAAINGYLGYKEQQEQEKARKDQALINMYAPLFGQMPQALAARQNKIMPGIISGAMSGYDIASQLKNDEMRDNLYKKLMEDNGKTSQESLVTPYVAPEYSPMSDQSRAQFMPYFDPYNAWKAPAQPDFAPYVGRAAPAQPDSFAPYRS
jgi:hypothetical protein